MRPYNFIRKHTEKMYNACREHAGTYKHVITQVYEVEGSDVVC